MFRVKNQLRRFLPFMLFQIVVKPSTMKAQALMPGRKLKVMNHTP
jgi:hypothetical protein